MTTEKKKGSFSKIENRDEALKMVRDTSTAFYAIAGLQAVLSYWIGLGLLVDAAIYGGCSKLCVTANQHYKLM